MITQAQPRQLKFIPAEHTDVVFVVLDWRLLGAAAVLLAAGAGYLWWQRRR